MATLPAKDCSLCPRLVAFREQNRAQYPHFYNGAVPSFGPLDAQLLVVGLAPGLKGANATGRPFTGDFAGEVLYPALIKAGFAAQGAGRAEQRAGDFLENYYQSPAPCALHPASLTLRNVRITNAARCVPPENKPTTAEVKNCNGFLKAEIAAMPNLKVILTLGLVSHNAVLKALGLKAAAHKFGHGAVHELTSLRGGPQGRRGNLQPNAAEIASSPMAPRNDGLQILNSYHTSRYNINTGRLTLAMFDAVIAQAQALLETR